jgi:hypothetical protein
VDFSIPAESEARLRAIEEFVHARLLLRETALLAAGFAASEPDLEDLRPVRARGWRAPAVPAALGGLGLSLPASAVR